MSISQSDRRLGELTNCITTLCFLLYKLDLNQFNTERFAQKKKFQLQNKESMTNTIKSYC